MAVVDRNSVARIVRAWESASNMSAMAVISETPALWTRISNGLNFRVKARTLIAKGVSTS